MKSTLTFCLILCLFSLTATAQNTRSFLSISGGYSLPVGEMAQEKLNDPLSGLAGSGYYGQANYDFRVFRWLGLRASGSKNINTTNSGPIISKADSYATLLGDSYTWDTQVSKWKLNALLIGPALYLNFNRVQFEAHLQAGKIWANSPSVNLIGRSAQDSEPVNVDLLSASTSAMGYGAGASLRFPLIKNLFLHFTGDIIGAEAELKDVAITATKGSYQLVDKISDKRFIGVVNVGAGFGIAF
ncbi:hypothetical protein CLV98_102334 [Dyadobacter jejuensis]|uniref:Outer membrane protein with beta-barrel domain n=1 Tax=Dyadobacter jejuensis TaxID=1082580 RepID=A0A316ARP5_9BACT|nr:hypothetical protein [Dyadobacter jejuensis]PWJ59500.1 hypothetical protein CLV98_102334 [Dyadobacter jejuensis]